MIHQRCVFCRVQIIDPQNLLNLLNALIGQSHTTPLLIQNIIIWRQSLTNFCKLIISRRIVPRWRTNNQWCPRFINQNRVHLIHNRKVQLTLPEILHFARHIITQIVKPKLIVCPISNVCIIRLFSRRRTKMPESLIFVVLILIFRIIYKRRFVNNHTYRKPQKIIHRPIPARITLRQIIIHRHHMHTTPSQGIKIRR